MFKISKRVTKRVLKMKNFTDDQNFFLRELDFTKFAKFSRLKVHNARCGNKYEIICLYNKIKLTSIK